MRNRLPYFDKENPNEKLFGIVYYVIKKFFPYLSDADYDEACSIGFIKILQILKKYDSTKSKIGTFICFCVRREIECKIINRKQSVYFSSDKLDEFEQEEKSYRHEMWKQWEELKPKLYESLTVKQRRIFDLRCQGLKLREIAVIIGTTKANVDCFLRRIEQKGRQLCESK